MANQVNLSRVNMQDRVAYKDLIKSGPIGATGGGFPGAFAPPAAPASPVAPGVITRLRLLMKRLKAHASYTVAIGEDLGIVRPVVIPPANPKPTGSAKSLAVSQVEVKFVMKNFDGVLVESKRGGESDWSVLGAYIRSPFVDSRAPLAAGQPEVRSYRMRCFKGNDPLSDPSDTLTVTTTP